MQKTPTHDSVYWAFGQLPGFVYDTHKRQAQPKFLALVEVMKQEKAKRNPARLSGGEGDIISSPVV